MPVNYCSFVGKKLHFQRFETFKVYSKLCFFLIIFFNGIDLAPPPPHSAYGSLFYWKVEHLSGGHLPKEGTLLLHLKCKVNPAKLDLTCVPDYVSFLAILLTTLTVSFLANKLCHGV